VKFFPETTKTSITEIRPKVKEKPPQRREGVLSKKSKGKSEKLVSWGFWRAVFSWITGKMGYYATIKKNRQLWGCPERQFLKKALSLFLS
jgi:hypothetical protein